MWVAFTLLGVLSWALVNVLDSILVHQYEKHPIVLAWNQSYFSLAFLAVLGWFFPAESSWILWISIGGISAYFGDLFFWYVLRFIDVSVMNLAWAMLAVILSIVGIGFLHETWTLMQTVGVIGIFAGIAILCLRGRGALTIGGAGFLLMLALLYTPTNIIQKLAVADDSAFSVFFWSLLSREVFSFSVAWLIPSVRPLLKTALRVQSWDFHMLNALVVALWLAGMYFTTRAYSLGSISLISVIFNIQPFVVILIALFFALFIPRLVPRELLTKQSVTVKIASFMVVFAGLALLALPQ